MKPITPHDPFDELIAAALHGELTSKERTQFNARLQNDPAARAAYQEAQLMHDLLEKTHKNAQPDDAFEQRMVSGVRRKIQIKEHRETAWESVLFFSKLMRGWLFSKWGAGQYTAASSLAVVVLGLSYVLYHDVRVLHVIRDNGIANPSGNPESHLFFPSSLYANALGIEHAKSQARIQRSLAMASRAGEPAMVDLAPKPVMMPTQALQPALPQNQRMGTADKGTITLGDANTYTGSTTVKAGELSITGGLEKGSAVVAMNEISKEEGQKQLELRTRDKTRSAGDGTSDSSKQAQISPVNNINKAWDENWRTDHNEFNVNGVKIAKSTVPTLASLPSPDATPSPPPAEAETPDIGRKLIRNAELELEVKSFQAAIDQITILTKSAGGYIDTSHSQKSGNGKLQGTVVVKVLPQNLDDFLLKLRDLGKVENQSVKADDVTKDYFDTQARLENSKKMEVQLQDLLKRENGKVSDLLQVERELGRVRGEIEQMQGQLKLYDFQVQYATVTMQLREKDMNQAAAYLLKEQDDFSLFATDVEGTFQKARQSAEGFKAQILQANLNHNSGSDVSADLVVMVAPDQIESFLADVRTMGRVANFTRQTQRVAKDGGDSDQPADQTLTEKDKVQVHLSIRSDDESRKQVALTVVTPVVDTALDQAKAAVLANAGAEILSSSLNKTPQGQSTAQLSVRVPGKDYPTMIDAFKALGRTSSLSIQRNDDSGPGASGDDAPVIVSLSLTDNDTPLQETAMSVLTTGVDAQAQQIKKDAQASGVTVTASSFAQQPDGIEMAQMTFRLPMSKYPAFVESLKKLGKVESLTVRREDRPDQTRADDTAPVEINLNLHNQRDIVTDDSGLWSTLRQTFGDGVGALFGSVRVIGVMIAFLLPWAVTIALLAWVGRRIYLWRKK